MDKLKTFVAESNNERLQKRFEIIQTNLDKYESNGELIQKEYKDLNEHLNRLVEIYFSTGTGIRNELLKLRKEEREPTQIEEDLYWNTPNNGNGLKKYIRETGKLDISNEESKVKDIAISSVEVAKELLELKERLNGLKDKIVKKRTAQVKKEEEKAKVAGHKDVLMAKEHLDGVIESIHKEVVANNKKAILYRYETIQTALKNDNLKYDDKFYRRNEKPQSHQKAFSYSDLLSVANKEYSDKYFTLKDKATLHEQADKEAEDIFQRLKSFYINRISQKVGVILNHKENLDSIKTISLNATQEIEAYLQFKFKDGSQFDLSTKVEWSTLPSNHTQCFMRVPTRFHNAIAPDGTKHTQLSEKIVQDIYLKDYSESQNVKDYLKGKGKCLKSSNKNKL